MRTDANRTFQRTLLGLPAPVRFQGIAESIGPMLANCHQIPGQEPPPPAGRLPSPGKRNCVGRNTPLLIVRDEFRPAIP